MNTAPLPSWLQVVKDSLERSIETARVPHAILLESAPGWGVFKLADRIAARLLSVDASYDLSRHLDYLHIELEGRSSLISINQIRDAIDFLSTTAREGGRKLVLVKEADRLSIPASQALLKVLEEPPLNKHLLLATTNSSALLPTIRSRCAKFVVQNGSAEQVTEFVEARIGSTADLNEFLRDYGGAPYAAVAALDQKRVNLTAALTRFARRQISLTDLARELRQEEADDILLRWQYITLRFARNSASVQTVATFYDELSDVRRQFREVPGLDRERQLIRLLIKWRELLAKHQRLQR
ncbi:MAG: hypothetical protein OXG05_01010 [Gammaproteobacteria bacterium]|nr:hypothetical protein [Gammaproteobacteria bacterium]